MADTKDKFVTADGLAKVMQGVGGGGVQFVELFHGNSASVTLPQSFDTYKVLFVVGRTIDGAASGVCVPPDNYAVLHEGRNHTPVSFSGKTASAPYLYTIERIYAIA